jgi:hypothetical protein
MKACCGVELNIRSFLTPTQCYIEVNGQICYPVALTVREETPVPIEFEACVQGGVAGGGGGSCAATTDSRVEIAANLAAKLIF